jgi:hypothetical protein
MSSLSAQIKEHVSPNVKQVMTDEFTAHPAAMIGAGIHGSKHETIKHKDKIYVRGESIRTLSNPPSRYSNAV